MVKNVTEKKKAKILIRFHNANKTNSYNRGGKRRGKKSGRIYRTSQNTRIRVTAVRAVSLSGSHSPPRLPRMPSSTVRISGPAVRAAHIVILSYSCILLVLLLYSCLQCPQLSELVLSELLLWELSMTLYIFHRHRVCLVDRVDLIRSLYSW